VGNGCAAAPTGDFNEFLVGNMGTGVGLGYNINASMSPPNFIAASLAIGANCAPRVPKEWLDG